MALSEWFHFFLYRSSSQEIEMETLFKGWFNMTKLLEFIKTSQNDLVLWCQLLHGGGYEGWL